MNTDRKKAIIEAVENELKKPQKITKAQAFEKVAEDLRLSVETIRQNYYGIGQYR